MAVTFYRTTCGKGEIPPFHRLSERPATGGEVITPVSKGTLMVVAMLHVSQYDVTF
ncbi:MAG: hypothetical protein LBS03_06380 [Bacteroidales bacterium]|nr:hypothetical protein [Bacteroidales bacterium]